MKINLLLTLLIIVITLYSCEKKCSCESVVYESTFETSYEWVENSREPSESCERDTISSTFLDDNGNTSYVRTILDGIKTITHQLIITFRLKIVKDKRIRREKYVYKVQNGQTDKVISNFNSIKYKRLLKKKKESNLLVDSYSTVTDLARFLG